MNLMTAFEGKKMNSVWGGKNALGTWEAEADRVSKFKASLVYIGSEFFAVVILFCFFMIYLFLFTL